MLFLIKFLFILCVHMWRVPPVFICVVDHLWPTASVFIICYVHLTKNESKYTTITQPCKYCNDTKVITFKTPLIRQPIKKKLPSSLLNLFQNLISVPSIIKKILLNPKNYIADSYIVFFRIMSIVV